MTVSSGWPKSQIEECAAKKQAMIDSGKDVIVGVNKYALKKVCSHSSRFISLRLWPQEDHVEVRCIDNAAVRNSQIERLKKVAFFFAEMQNTVSVCVCAQLKETRDSNKVKSALEAISQGAKNNKDNMLALCITAAHARATVIFSLSSWIFCSNVTP